MSDFIHSNAKERGERRDDDLRDLATPPDAAAAADANRPGISADEVFAQRRQLIATRRAYPLKFSFSPGLGHLHLKSLPVEEQVIQASRISAPPKQILVVTRSGKAKCSADYIARLEQAGILPSMSRAGCPYDNAMAESFMKTLKVEEVDGRDYRDLEDAKICICAFIDAVYNCQRLHSALDYLSPEEFEEDQARSWTARPPTALWTAIPQPTTNSDCYQLTCLKRGGHSTK